MVGARRRAGIARRDDPEVVGPPGLSPLTVFETFVELEPEPALEDDVFVP